MLLAALITPALHPGPATAAPTDADVAAMTPADQAGLLQPLRRLAGALAIEGRANWRAVYAGVEIDAVHDAVELFTAGDSSDAALLAAARRATPDAEWSRVRLRSARHSRSSLEAAARRAVAGPAGSQLAAVSVPVDGSGIRVRIAAGATAPRLAGLGVPFSVQRANPNATKSWAANKWHDSAPFIGGDVVTAKGHGYCTAGLPAVRTRDRKPVLITAAHCFPRGTRVYTAAGTAGQYRRHQLGAYVGTVGAANLTWDAERVLGADNNADESDTTGWKPLTSTGYSYVGDYVCHNGQASFYLGHPTPCGIKVTDDDLWFRIGHGWARGVEGIDARSGWGSHNGDSGATVFAVEPHARRQARGIVSSGGRDGTSDQKRVDWAEAPYIFHAFGLMLNPRT